LIVHTVAEAIAVALGWTVFVAPATVLLARAVEVDVELAAPAVLVAEAAAVFVEVAGTTVPVDVA
jgi:hypothetical protein